MIIVATPLQGLFELQVSASADERGEFSRLFCEQEFSPIRPALHFTQINLSETKHKGSIRGMHLQTPPDAEAKLIKCLRGRVLDVAVDVRKDSLTFLQSHAVELSEDNGLAVLIPEGFAHGFQTLSDDVQMLYMHTASWSPKNEYGLRFDDPRLAIQWPLAATIVSKKDANYPLIASDFAGIGL